MGDARLCHRVPQYRERYDKAGRIVYVQVCRYVLINWSWLRRCFYLSSFSSGTSFKVYGRLSKATSATDFGAFPNTSYAIDGGQPTPFFGVPSFERDLLYQMFYASPPLANTKHTLIGTCEDEGGRVILDYIAVELPVDSDLSVKSSPLPLSASKYLAVATPPTR